MKKLKEPFALITRSTHPCMSAATYVYWDQGAKSAAGCSLPISLNLPLGVVELSNKNIIIILAEIPAKQDGEKEQQASGKRKVVLSFSSFVLC